MSAETLRRAAALMRERADWLDSVHANLSTYNATTPQSMRAFAIARAYLGEDQ